MRRWCRLAECAVTERALQNPELGGVEIELTERLLPANRGRSLEEFLKEIRPKGSD